MNKKTMYDQGYSDAMAGASASAPESTDYMAGYEDACEAMQAAKV